MNNIDENKLIEQLTKQNWSVAYEHIDKVTEEEYASIRLKEGFGASDSSRLLDVNPFPRGDHESLIDDKVTGYSDKSIGEKASVRMGKDIEHIILDKGTECLGTSVYKPYNMYKADDGTFLTVNFDGVAIINDDFIPVEAKAVTKYGRKHYNFTKSRYYQTNGNWQSPRNIEEIKCDIEDPQEYIEVISNKIGIPPYYYTQVMQQMIPLNSPYGYLIVMDVDNWDIHIFKILRDEKIINQLQMYGTLYGIKVKIKRKNKK